MTSNINGLKLICKPASLLAEGPLWNILEKKLYFTDIEKCCLWRLDPSSDQTEKFYQGDKKIGGFAFSRDGGLVLCAGKHVVKLHADGYAETLFVMDFPEVERFNDITTDPEGRIFAGTMNAGLYRLEKGKSPVSLLDKVNCSNGMTFSLDEKTFYHTATKDCVVNVYDYDRTDGTIFQSKGIF